MEREGGEQVNSVPKGVIITPCNVRWAQRERRTQGLLDNKKIVESMD